MSTRRTILNALAMATALLVGTAITMGQGITVPNTFTNGTAADASQVNANFAALSSGALNRTGGTMTGTLNSRHILPVTDGTYDLGDGTHQFRNAYFSGTITAAAFSGADAVPAGTVIFYDGAACPTGYAELTSARGRYLVGKPSGGTLGGTAGTALTDLENRAVGQHSHTFTQLTTGSPKVPSTGSGSDLVSGTTSATTSTEGSVAGTNAPYLQLLVCKKS